MTQGRGRSTRPLVMEFLTRHPNQPIYIKDIVTDTGLSEEQVKGAIQNIRYADVDGARSAGRLETIVRGNQWRWHDKPRTSTGRLYEELATTKTGAVLVQDEDGNIFKLTEV